MDGGMLVRAKSKTDPAHGCPPEKRSIDELLRLGAICLDKPPGPTSHQVVAWLKSIVDVDKAGHGGTLDPRVTGVLPVLLGRARRLARTLLLAPKEYVGVLRLHGQVTRDSVESIFREFTGEIYQKPSLKSAVRRRIRQRSIYGLELLDWEPPLALFQVRCEAGTYVRKLCHDIGDAMGVGGHMSDLRRTRSGPFTEDEKLVTLQQLADAVYCSRHGDEAPLRRAILPVEFAVSHLPRIVVVDSAVDAVCRGAPLYFAGISAVDDGVSSGDMVSLLTLKGELISVAESKADSDALLKNKKGDAARTTAVVMSAGTYPKGWT